VTRMLQPELSRPEKRLYIRLRRLPKHSKVNYSSKSCATGERAPGMQGSLAASWSRRCPSWTLLMLGNLWLICERLSNMLARSSPQP